MWQIGGRGPFTHLYDQPRPNTTFITHLIYFFLVLQVRTEQITQLEVTYNRSPTTGETQAFKHHLKQIPSFSEPKNTKKHSCSIDRKNWEFRKRYYNTLPRYCMTNIIFDRNDPEKMAHVGCNRLSCPRCRSKLKNHLLDRIVAVATGYGLLRELILTCPGGQWRKNHDSNDSFPWMNKKFDSFKVLYERKTGKKLQYIKLPRSQKSGYCHSHILIDQYIPQSLIEDIIKRVGLGKIYKIKLRDIQRLGSYLKNEFFKDHEWYIPVGMHHISSSMNVLDDGYRRSIFRMWLPGGGNYCMIVFGRYVPPHIKYDFVYDVVQNHADRPPPWWLFIECFKEVSRLQQQDGYVAEIKKYYLTTSAVPAIPPAYNYQMELNGRLHRIVVDLEPPKITHQKKFKTGGFDKNGRPANIG